ncbi:flagellar assembly protein FliH [Actinotalea sp. M2MS4P-6]|uniref:FliH/SctL family protein n=1 Tax=Actinotalea sp. M2MS4P-6 TaxID=2983762 RepID=UPI0021E4DF03|nr:flagellar assembly protein FliH [Actinotalea sp. M2MS4P-6]MCV2392788.1 flagellar assembly protein FliH [Actinotalea sp. M2MS4P-6]
MSPETTEATPFRLAQLAPRISREEDRAAGYAEGWAAGARAAAEQAAQQRAALAAQHQAGEARRDAALAAAVQRLERAAAAADARTAPAVAEVRAVLTTAALELARAVLGAELSDAETGARAALTRALSAPAELGVHTVRLAPADHALLSAAGVAPQGVALVADPRLQPGDAISEHPAGYLDAQLATAMDRARRALLGEDA